MTAIKTSSWFDPLPAGHLRIGISRGVPRHIPAGFPIFSDLAPGPWFNRVGTAEYDRRYRAEILDRLDPAEVARRLLGMARGGVPVMVCYERVRSGKWCHRALAAEWLSKSLGITVPEFAFEDLAQEDHPMMAAELRRRPLPPAVANLRSGILL